MAHMSRNEKAKKQEQNAKSIKTQMSYNNNEMDVLQNKLIAQTWDFENKTLINTNSYVANIEKYLATDIENSSIDREQLQKNLRTIQNEY